MNNDQDIIPIMEKLKLLRDAKGMTIIFLHHTPKNDQMQYKGSTSFIDSVDFAYVLEPHHTKSTLNFKFIGAKKRIGGENFSLNINLNTHDTTILKISS